MGKKKVVPAPQPIAPEPPPHEFFTVVWDGITIEVEFSPHDIMNHEHLQLRVPSKHLIPVTDTGYRSEFLTKGTCEKHGGPKAYVHFWLDGAAKSTTYRKQKAQGQQLQLF